MEFNRKMRREQARPHGKQCTGCAGPATAPGSTGSLLPNGRMAFACPACSARIAADPGFEQEVGTAAMADTTVPNLRRIFASIGIFELPTTVAEYEEAFGLAPGTAEAMFGG